MSDTILVFGHNGQVARELMRARLPAGWSLVALGREQCDIADAAAVARTIAETAPAVIVNAAAYTAVDRAESESERAFAVNRDGAAHIAVQAQASGAPLIHISTDYVFGGEAGGIPLREDDPVNPRSVYGASKLASEMAVRAACPRHAILRTSWVYSPFGHNFARTMLRLGQERAELRVVDDQTGCPTAAADIAAIVIAMAERLVGSQAPAFGTYHGCSEGAVTWYGFAAEIFRLAAARGRAVPRLIPIVTSEYPTAAMRPRYSVLDCSKLARQFGLAFPAWQDSLRDGFDELLAQADAAG